MKLRDLSLKDIGLKLEDTRMPRIFGMILPFVGWRQIWITPSSQYLCFDGNGTPVYRNHLDFIGRSDDRWFSFKAPDGVETVVVRPHRTYGSEMPDNKVLRAASVFSIEWFGRGLVAGKFKNPFSTLKGLL